MKFKNLLITPKHNDTHSCSTPNCECLICGDCWIHITHKGRGFDEMTEADMPSIYDKFKCPYPLGSRRWAFFVVYLQNLIIMTSYMNSLLKKYENYTVSPVIHR
jgi:hypothetical protein